MFKMIYTTHAICRTFGRNITEESIEATLEYGRNCERNRKAITYRLDRRSIAKAKANIEVYLENPVGIGEHPDVLAAIQEQVDIIAHEEERIEVLDKHFTYEN